MGHIHGLLIRHTNGVVDAIDAHGKIVCQTVQPDSFGEGIVAVSFESPFLLLCGIDNTVFDSVVQGASGRIHQHHSAGWFLLRKVLANPRNGSSGAGRHDECINLGTLLVDFRTGRAVVHGKVGFVFKLVYKDGRNLVLLAGKIGDASCNVDVMVRVGNGAVGNNVHHCTKCGENVSLFRCLVVGKDNNAGVTARCR